jgi:fatty acid-binding protein DegV
MIFLKVCSKYTTGYKYKTSQLKIDKFDKKFESLYMDDDGILVV